MFYLIVSGLATAQEKTMVLEALFYLDHSPVRVEIKGGEITQLTRIDELADKEKNV